ncbi:MAG TPA: NAD-dependent epimerase/dehydratase family protein [Allosphingosinicella sp.]|nr:NAD-dependent epimerase/dehydratase family protein [Allosphingosinicella sp.]
MKILVTGATGGIGRTLVPLLAARGLDVVATGRDSAVGRTLERPRVRFVPLDLVRGDLRPLVADARIVVHLAARSSPWGPYAGFHDDNVVATARLVDAAARSGVERFVHASTPAIFSERRHRLDLRSGDRPAARPANGYAATKLEAERLVTGEGRMATIVLRPSAVLGPDDKAILPRLMRVLSRGVLPVGNGGVALFHPTDVRDSAEAFAAAAAGSSVGVVNVAGREPVGIVEMARALARRLGLSLRVRCVPEPVLHALAAAAELGGRATGREPPLTRYSVSNLSWSRSFDLRETEALLGWAPAFGPMDALDHAVPR